jgi:hypothetical protein
MKFFCKLKPSTKEVLQVRVIGDDVAGEDMSAQGEQHCANTYGGEWKQCSKDGSFRKWYPGIGWFYREDLDAFVAAQPYPSWTLNTTTCVWDPPTPKPFDPDNTIDYTWNEDTQSWDQIT